MEDVITSFNSRLGERQERGASVRAEPAPLPRT
jgi:hypothetical protein